MSFLVDPADAALLLALSAPITACLFKLLPTRTDKNNQPHPLTYVPRELCLQQTTQILQSLQRLEDLLMTHVTATPTPQQKEQ